MRFYKELGDPILAGVSVSDNEIKKKQQQWRSNEGA
jgi:hypothetical protein